MSFLSLLRSRNLLQDCSDAELDQKIARDSSFYVGFDPTSPNLHIGNLIQAIVSIHLAKYGGLRPIILFGGSTGSIGDPSGRSAERQLLDRSVIDANVASQTKIMQGIFARAGVECQFVNNYDWTSGVTLLDFLRDVGKYFTVNYMIAKEVVKTRLEGDGISFTEFSYMLLQAYDFLHLYQHHNCRLQFGGSDQWGNITAGLELIRRSVQGDAFAFSVPLCTDSEGKKFGKTAAGAIWINAEGLSPYQFHQYWLNSADADVEKLLQVFTFKSLEEISQIIEQHKITPEKRIAQSLLADSVSELVHGDEAVREANLSRSVLFGGSMDELPEHKLLEIFADVPSSEILHSQLGSLTVLELFAQAKLVPSKGEARRLIQNGGAYINNQRISDGTVTVAAFIGSDKTVLVLRSGKKNYHLARVVESR